ADGAKTPSIYYTLTPRALFSFALDRSAPSGFAIGTIVAGQAGTDDKSVFSASAVSYDARTNEVLFLAQDGAAGGFSLEKPILFFNFKLRLDAQGRMVYVKDDYTGIDQDSSRNVWGILNDDGNLLKSLSPADSPTQLSDDLNNEGANVPDSGKGSWLTSVQAETFGGLTGISYPIQTQPTNMNVETYPPVFDAAAVMKELSAKGAASVSNSEQAAARVRAYIDKQTDPAPGEGSSPAAAAAVQQAKDAGQAVIAHADAVADQLAR
ncbi:MAG TPA: hypothetical protein VH309_12840, partial [Elusimicrobiota bacterium]|nr:hypothetical protein [Elusimicrobiota bacterium]